MLLIQTLLIQDKRVYWDTCQIGIPGRDAKDYGNRRILSDAEGRLVQIREVAFVTLAEGAITELHVGFKGTLNALYLKDLADQTHRGFRGRAEAGKSRGGRSLGYRVVRAGGGVQDATGE